MNEYVQAFMTVISLINPVICGAIFVGIQGKQAGNGQNLAAVKAMLSVFIILALSAVFGIKVLGVFGISLDAFSVAGGMILAWMGFAMLGKKPTKPDAQDHDATPRDSNLTPLILFAASPGTITGVITLSVAHVTHGLPVTALVAVALACLVTLLFLLLSSKMGSVSGNSDSLLKDTVSRFMGLIVLAMGVQFALAGLQGFSA